MSLRLNFSVKGIKALRKEFESRGPKGVAAMAAAMYRKGNDIMTNSIRRTPVDTGFLRNSSYVTRPSKTRNEVELGYGAEYAIHVHENTTARHEVGEAKFLQRAVNRSRRTLIRELADLAESNFKRGRGPRSIAGVYPTRPKGGGGRG